MAHYSMSRLISFTVFIIIASTAYPQLSPKYPNVYEDNIEEDNLFQYVSIPITINGAIGLVYEVKYIKPNLMYLHAYAGIGAVINFDLDEIEGANNRIFKFMGDLEIGYPWNFWTRKGTVKIETANYYEDNAIGQSTNVSEYYKVKVPVYHMLTPIVGMSFDPIVTKIAELNNPDFALRYNVSLPSLNLGVKLISRTNTFVKITDAKSKELITSYPDRLGALYLGMAIPLINNKEISSGYTSIPSASPTLEFYWDIATYRSNWESLCVGIKSFPYVRDNVLTSTGDRKSSGAYQFFLSVKYIIE